MKSRIESVLETIGIFTCIIVVSIAIVSFMAMCCTVYDNRDAKEFAVATKAQVIEQGKEIEDLRNQVNQFKFYYKTDNSGWLYYEEPKKKK